MKVKQVTVPIDLQTVFYGDLARARMHPEIALDHVDFSGDLLAICYKGVAHGCIRWRVYYAESDG